MIARNMAVGDTVTRKPRIGILIFLSLINSTTLMERAWKNALK